VPSPFPGMDPYLENPAIWPDLHVGLNAAIRAELNKRLPARYAARIDRYVWIHEPGADERTLLGKPDVYVAETTGSGSGSGHAAVLTAPATVVLPAVRREGNRYIKIVDLQNHRVVTVLEVLSPANKNPGKDRDAYLMKRNEYLATEINLIEIDLLRSGEHMPWGGPPPPPADYYILISPAREFPRAGLWPLSVRDPLPEIPIPLNPGDQETFLPVQTCFDRAHDEGRYTSEVNYAEPPTPPLPEPDATWARELLTARRR